MTTPDGRDQPLSWNAAIRAAARVAELDPIDPGPTRCRIRDAILKLIDHHEHHAEFHAHFDEHLPDSLGG